MSVLVLANGLFAEFARKHLALLQKSIPASNTVSFLYTETDRYKPFLQRSVLSHHPYIPSLFI